ncbi:type VII secretion protein EccE [Mycobacterium kansasii]
MKQPVIGARLNVRAMVAAELTAVGASAGLLLAGVPELWAVVIGIVVAAGVCLVTIGGLTCWQWARLAWRWIGHRDRKPALPDAVDVEVGGETLGVIIDGHTVITMVSVWGKPYVPTWLRPHHAETPNTLPITVIAKQMRRFGLGVDVDVICEGRRTATDNYAALYATFLGGRAAAGRRTTTLMLRMDTHAPDTTTGLLWRPNSVEAAAAVTRRMVRALRQANCRAQILTAAQMREAAIAGLGGPDGATGSYRDRWKALQRPGRGYVTSFYFSAEDITGAQLDDVWSHQCEHTALVVALRRGATGVRASALVRLSTAQPLVTTPSLVLNRYSGRQWEAIAHTVAGRARLAGLPSAPVTGDLDRAVVVGPSGVMIGKLGDGLLLMPLSDPAGPTRIAMHADNDVAVRQLIRRAAAAGERVAVYDSTGRWTMTAGSSRIWTSTDMTAQPPRPPTLVVHNGRTNPYPGAWASIVVGGPTMANPDIILDQRGNQIQLGTKRFTTVVEAVTFRNEQTYLN